MSVFTNPIKLVLKISAAFLLILGISGTSQAVVLYGIETNADNLFTIDTDTGTVNTVGSLGANWGLGGVAFSGDTLYGINTSNGGLYSIDSNTGAASLVGNTGISPLESLAIIDGVGYSQDVFTNNLYSIDLSTGLSTLIGGYAGSRITGLTTDGTNLFGTRIFDQDIVQVDLLTGGILDNIGTHGLANDTSLAYAGGSFYTIPAFSGTLYELDGSANPTALYSGLGLGHVTGLTAAAMANVPEAGTLALLASNMLIIGFVMRRRRKQS